MKSLEQKLKNTRNELEELRHRKTEKVESAKFVSQTDQIKDLTHSIMNLSFAGKQRLLHGVLDGPVVVGHSIVIPHYDLENTDIEELSQALPAFKAEYNSKWILHRHGCKTPAQVRAGQIGSVRKAA